MRERSHQEQRLGGAATISRGGGAGGRGWEPSDHHPPSPKQPGKLNPRTVRGVPPQGRLQSDAGPSPRPHPPGLSSLPSRSLPLPPSQPLLQSWLQGRTDRQGGVRGRGKGTQSSPHSNSSLVSGIFQNILFSEGDARGAAVRGGLESTLALAQPPPPSEGLSAVCGLQRAPEPALGPLPVFTGRIPCSPRSDLKPSLSTQGPRQEEPQTTEQPDPQIATVIY